MTTGKQPRFENQESAGVLKTAHSLLIMRSNVRFETTHDARSPLEQAIVELQRLHEMFLGDDLEPCVLTEFRDALNRVRTAAWAAQQYVIR
jgi:hypothetical protein